MIFSVDIDKIMSYNTSGSSEKFLLRRLYYIFQGGTKVYKAIIDRSFARCLSFALRSGFM